jgi:hypothetical protein
MRRNPLSTPRHNRVNRRLFLTITGIAPLESRLDAMAGGRAGSFGLAKLGRFASRKPRSG